MVDAWQAHRTRLPGRSTTMGRFPKWVWVAVAAMMAAGLLMAARGLSDGQDEELRWPQCHAGAIEYGDYVADLKATMQQVLVQTDRAAVQALLWELGYQLEQNYDRYSALIEVCQDEGSIERGFVPTWEIRDAGEIVADLYVGLVSDCVEDGIHDCGALVPAVKAACEADPDKVFRLDATNVRRWHPLSIAGCRDRVPDPRSAEIIEMLIERIEQNRNEGF